MSAMMENPAAAASADGQQKATSPRSVAETEIPLLKETAENQEQQQLVSRNSEKSSSIVSSSSTNVGGYSFEIQGFRFTLNRKTILLIGVVVVAAVALFVAGAAVLGGLLALITSPIWIPVALVTSPLWVPVIIFTCPLWLTGLVLAGMGLTCGAVTVTGIFLFFTWPADWLPSDGSCEWFLDSRNRATVYLVKLQAKLVLYAAGVGPLADAAFALVDHVDLVQLQKSLQEIDLKEWTEKVRQMDIQEMQAALLGALRSLVGF